MLVVGDLDDVFLPKPNDILVNLVEAKAGVENLLSRLNDMFHDTHNTGNALGAGLQAAFKLIVSRACDVQPVFLVELIELLSSLAVPRRRKDCLSIGISTEPRTRCSQEPRRQQDSRHFERINPSSSSNQFLQVFRD